MTFVVALLGLILLIVIHELGHMLTAKALGVRVPEFGVGFGPPLIKRKIGKTVYSVRIILLGGFAKMAGMGDGEEGPDTYPAKAPWRRALIIVAGPVANILAAVAILAGVYMFQGEVTDIKPVVQVVEPNSMAEGVGMRTGDRIVGFGGERVKTWEEFEREMKDREPGEEEFYENVTGPVGIASVGSTAVIQGFFLPLLALISLNLAIFNLLPILPLDGGHLFFIAAEKVIGRPVSEQTMGKIAVVGIVLVLVLFLFATYADLSKILTGQPFIPE